MQELQVKHRLVEVKWDTNDDLGIWHDPLGLGLPEIVTVPGDIEEDDISDYLSDRGGYCHFGWNFVEDSGVK